MALQLILAQDEDTFLKKAAQLIMESSVAAIERGGVFTIAFSGGQTPRKLFSLLADSYYRDRINWTKTHVFWGDERFVPPNHPDSNYKMAFDTLLSKVPCPAANIHRIPAEMESAVDAARAYEQSLKLFFRSVMVRNPSAQNQVETSLGDIFPRFDLILLGVGEDGHTASLFPGTSALSEKRKWVTAVHVEKVGGDRISITYPLINNARRVLVLCAGESKAAVVKEIFQGDGADTRFPAQLVKPTDELFWLLDRGSAAKLPAAIRYSAMHV